jgi:hypothetical protein
MPFKINEFQIMLFGGQIDVKIKKAPQFFQKSDYIFKDEETVSSR